MNHRKLFNDKDELDSSLLNQINLYLEKNNSKKNNDINEIKFEKYILNIDSTEIIIIQMPSLERPRQCLSVKMKRLT